jgi:hypothetical protein
MSCGCSDTIILKKPIHKDFQASGNVSLEIATDLWEDQEETIPLDLIGWTARGSIGRRDGNTVNELQEMTVVIAMDADETVVYGVVSKSNVEDLPQLTPLVYDIACDRTSDGYSFTVIEGNLIFNPLPGT